MKQKKSPNPRYKSICLPFESEAGYLDSVSDSQKFHAFIEEMISLHPELFPKAITGGFKLHDKRASVKQGLILRRIKLKATGEVYLIRPSSLLPFMSGKTDEVEKALYLRQWGVPFEALAYCFGRDAMYYYRAWVSIGRNQIVGTSVKDAARLPQNLIADEKHTYLRAQKNYLASTVGSGCLLGASLCEEATTESLQKGYGVFVAECLEVKADYQAKTVCTDGWKATRECSTKLFPKVVLILCYLHSVLKIKNRCRDSLREKLLKFSWHVYHARTKVSVFATAEKVSGMVIKEYECKGTGCRLEVVFL